MSVDALLAGLCGEALHRSTGEFSLDHSRLVSGYASLVAGQPGLALLRILQLAVKLGAFQVAIQLGRSDFTVRLENIGRAEEVLDFLHHFPGRGELQQDLGAVCYLLLAQGDGSRIELSLGDRLGHRILRMDRRDHHLEHHGEFAEAHLSLRWQPGWEGWWQRFRQGRHWVSGWLAAVRHQAVLYPLRILLDGREASSLLDSPLIPARATHLHYQPAHHLQEALALHHPMDWHPSLLYVGGLTHPLDAGGPECHLLSAPEPYQALGTRELNRDRLSGELRLGQNSAENKLWIVAHPRGWLLPNHPLQPFACSSCVAVVEAGRGGILYPARHGILLGKLTSPELPDHLVAIASLPDHLKTDLSGMRPVLSAEWSQWVHQLACTVSEG